MKTVSMLLNLVPDFGYSDGPGDMSETGNGYSCSSCEYESSSSTDTVSSSCQDERGYPFSS